MISSVLFLLMFVGLAVFFGWLTYRAIRAHRLWVKIAGGIGAGLLMSLFAVIAFTGGKGIVAIYFPGAPAAPILTVSGAPEQIERGEYLVNLSCIGCHGAASPDGNPTEQQPLTGGWNIAAAEGFSFMGDMITENLTPGGKLAGYSDGELFRVLRHSVDKQGTKLGFMDFLPYKELSDDDTQAIIAYLRSLPAASSTATTGDSMNYVGAVLTGSGMFPPSVMGAESVQAPPSGVNAEYGKYVATYGECRGCHGPDATGTAASAMGPAIPNPRLLVGTLNQDQFFEMMRGGIKPDGVAFPDTMPWQNAARMTDNDLAALFAYLTAPVE
jgi:cytochrome c553